MSWSSAPAESKKQLKSHISSVSPYMLDLFVSPCWLNNLQQYSHKKQTLKHLFHQCPSERALRSSVTVKLSKGHIVQFFWSFLTAIKKYPCSVSSGMSSLLWCFIFVVCEAAEDPHLNTWLKIFLNQWKHRAGIQWRCSSSSGCESFAIKRTTLLTKHHQFVITPTSAINTSIYYICVE